MASALADLDVVCRRLVLLPPDEAMEILKSVVCQGVFTVRTHAVDIAKPFATAYDQRIEQVTREVLDMCPDDEDANRTLTRALSHLPVRMGGCGLTRLTALQKAAYEASYEAAMGISNVRQEDRMLAFNEDMIAGAIGRDPTLGPHLAAAKAAPFAAFTKASMGQQQHFAPEAVKAAVRHRLRAPHKSLPVTTRCPGCQKLLASVEFAPHVSGCTRIHGFNSSSRHALVKNVLNDVFAAACVPHDSSEPREFGEILCPGCDEKFEDEGKCSSHMEQCAKVRRIGKAAPKPRRSGPDGRIYLSEGSVVFDLTIVAPTAPSYVHKGPNAAMQARIADKTRKYAEEVSAAGEEFVVAGLTSFGALSKETKELLKRVARHSEGRVTQRDLEGQLGCAAFLMTGHVIYAAERRAGVIHSRNTFCASSSPPLAPAPSSATAVSDAISSSSSSSVTLSQISQQPSGRDSVAVEVGSHE